MTDTPHMASGPGAFETRPWGQFRTLEAGPGYKVKQLVVLPGHRLSLQKHRYRMEHWVVVAGTATVINGAETLRLRPADSTVIPRNGWHRIENRGRLPVIVIEVQYGTRVVESDILRREDDYGRTANALAAPNAERRIQGRRGPGRISIETRGAETADRPLPREARAGRPSRGAIWRRA